MFKHLRDKLYQFYPVKNESNFHFGCRKKRELKSKRYLGTGHYLSPGGGGGGRRILGGIT